MTTPAFQQQADNSGNNSAPNVTLGSSATVGNLLIAFCGSGSGIPPSALANGWNIVAQGGALSTGYGIVAYRYVQSGDNTTPPALTTVTSISYWWCSIVEVSGVSGTWADDFSQVQTGFGIPGASTITTSSFNTSSANNLAILGAGQYDGTPAFSGLSAGWTDESYYLDYANYGATLTAVETFPTSGTAVQASWSAQNVGSDYVWYAIVCLQGTPPPTGTWASTEAPDIMDFVDIPPVTGTWTSTEAKDTMNFHGAPPFGLDGYATGSNSGGGSATPGVTSSTVTLSTTFADDVIVVGVVSTGYWNASEVTSITDTAGLTWKKRNSRWILGSFPSVELWWAHAPTALAGDIITVHTANSGGHFAGGGTGSIALIAWGVSGANYTTPWDKHTQAGSYTDDIDEFYPTEIISQAYTSATNTFMFGLQAIQTVTPDSISYGAYTPFTFVTSSFAPEEGAGGYSATAQFAYYVADAPQNSVAVEFGYLYGGADILFSSAGVMADAIVALGESGTTDAVYWYLDPTTNSGVISLTSGHALTLSYSAFNNGLMAVLPILIRSASSLGEVTSVTSTQAGSPGWERRSRHVSGQLAYEVWWAYYPTAAADDVVTVTTTNTVSGDIIAGIITSVGGTTGSYGLGDPFWDPSPSLPALNGDLGSPSTGYPYVTDLSTITPHTLLLAFVGNVDPSAPEQGFTNPFVATIPNANNPQGGTDFTVPVSNIVSTAPAVNMAYEWLYSSGLATDETAEFLTSPEPAAPWIMIGDAIPVGPPQPPTGVWASTEHADIFAATGFVPAHGVWASTEHADEFTGAPAQAPYDSVGWLGWVPAFATWASTGTPDHMTFDGWLLGFGGITGQMGAVETADRFGATDYAIVTGTWASVESKDRMADNGYLIPLPGPPEGIRKRRVMIIT